MFFQGCFKKKFPQNARGVCGRSGRLAVRPGHARKTALAKRRAQAASG